MLYIPANQMPIMVTEVLGNKMNSTIIAGVILLWDSGPYPVDMVIFIASIMVPSLKMLAIGCLCWDVNGKRENHADSKRMNLIDEMVEDVGRWSMIDVFVISVCTIDVGAYGTIDEHLSRDRCSAVRSGGAPNYVRSYGI
jgi:paraquat-inducible protein A